MAISKTQPMRAAEIALVDAANDLDVRTTTNTNAIAAEVTARENADTTLSGRITTNANAIENEALAREYADTSLYNSVMANTDAIAAEALARESADTSLSNAIDTEITQRVNGDSTIMSVIGNGFTSVDTVTAAMTALQTFSNRFRFGVTQTYTLAPNTYEPITVTLLNPFLATDEVVVFLCPIGDSESFADIRTTLTSATPYGFTANLDNDDTSDSHDIALGYLMIKVN